MASLKIKLTEDMKAAMRAKEKERLGTIRMILAAVKQKEIDERVDVDDEAMLPILTKLAKQRRESIEQYQRAARDDLVAVEQFELDVIANYLPKPLSDEDLLTLVAQCIAESGAESVKDMGKVMALIKSKAQGRADMGKVSKLIKVKLNS